jgi:hypothetical protein
MHNYLLPPGCASDVQDGPENLRRRSFDMDIRDYIAREQNQVVGLINELLDINLHAVQQRFFDDIRAELIMQIEAKRRVLYPILERGTDLTDITREDAEILNLLTQLNDEGMTSPKWMVMFGELKHAVEHQIAEADAQLFAPIRDGASPVQTSELVARMEAAKQDVQRERNLSVTHVASS